MGFFWFGVLLLVVSVLEFSFGLAAISGRLDSGWAQRFAEKYMVVGSGCTEEGHEVLGAVTLLFSMVEGLLAISFLLR